MSSRDWFADNWYNIVTGLIALIVVGTLAVLVFAERTIPDNFATITQIVVAFFFGAQVPRPASTRVREFRDTAQIVKDANQR